jgi:serine/threonine-protein kinase HipA
MYKPVMAILMAVNGKFAGITRADLLTVVDRFGIGTAPKVVQAVGEAVSAWADFAAQAAVNQHEVARVRAHHQAFSACRPNV